MPKFKYELTNGKTLTLEGDTQPSDAEVEQHAKDAGVELRPAKTIAERNAEARANMAKQANAGGAPSQWSASEMGNRALAGLKGEAEGFAGGLAAPAVAAYTAVRAMGHPIDTALAIGAGAGKAAEGVKDMVTMPGESADVLKDAVLKFASDPENIGIVAGSVMGAKASPAVVRAARNTAVGQAVNEAAERVPIAGRVVKVVAPSNATLEKNFGTAMKASDARFAARTARAERTAAATAPNNVVVPLADASASNPTTVAAESRAYGVPAPHPENSPVVSLADASASNPAAAVPDRPLPPLGPREPGRVTSLDQQLGLDPSLFRSGAADVPAPAPGARIATLIKGEPTRYVDQPMFRQQAAFETHGLPATDARSPSLPAGASSGNDIMNTTLPADFEVVDPEAGGGTQVNGSGESAASKEALSRQAGMKARGESFAVRKGGSTRILAGPDAVDYNPQPGEQFGIVDSDGQFRMLSLGEAREKLIGARGAGHLNKAGREALFTALQRRMAQ